MSIDLINFRSLAGIRMHDGRKIVSHAFYRGPAFIYNRLSFESKEAIRDIGFKHIIDFRGDDEVIRGGQVYIPDGCLYEHIPAISKAMEKNDDLNTFDNDFEGDYMAHIYRKLPFDNQAYRKVIGYIKDTEVPIYFHCSAGKDRTGVCAAIIELLLGADEDEIIEDYMKSSLIYKEYYSKVLKLPISDAWLCKVDWIKGSLNAITKLYATYEDYFLAEYGLDHDDIQRIRDRYLDQF